MKTFEAFGAFSILFLLLMYYMGFKALTIGVACMMIAVTILLAVIRKK